jgi:hypothetical protein
MLENNTKVAIIKGFYKGKIGSVYSTVTTHYKNINKNKYSYFVKLENGIEIAAELDEVVELKGLPKLLYGEVNDTKTQKRQRIYGKLDQKI